MVPWLWYFWIYSFLGWLAELAFAAASRSEEKRRRCLLLLPLCPVYGLGMLAALALPPMGGLGLAVFGGLAATAAEYAYHWAGDTPACPETSGGGSACPFPWPGGCWSGRRCASSSLRWRPWRQKSRPG